MPFEIEHGLNIRGWIASEIGGRSENQDSAGTITTSHGTIITVCDGMGGMGGGSVASKLAVQTIIDDYSKKSENIEDDAEFLKEVLNHANSTIKQHSKDAPELAHMGTTATVAIITDDCATVAHIGDSRIYQLRGKTKVFRTTDHSAVFEKVKKGQLTEEEARQNPHSNIILKALGIDTEIEPDIAILPYEKGDRFVLCTDGFWGAMPEPDFIKLIAKTGRLKNVVADATLKIDDIGLENGGGHDNLTAAIFDTTEKSYLKTKMRKKDKVLVAILSILLVISLSVNVLSIIKDTKMDESRQGTENVENSTNDTQPNESGNPIEDKQ